MHTATHLTAAVVLGLASAWPAAAAAVVDAPLTPLVIRLYDAPSLPGGSTRAAIEEAHEILQQAGFAPAWVSCTVTPAPPSRCALPLDGAELAVRVMLSGAPGLVPPPVAATRPLGYSLVDARTKSGTLATVYFDRVAWLADAARVDMGALLGRAIAHEIGHLLLGTNEHAGSGVMRAMWSRDALRNSRPADWRFRARDAKQMRAALAARREVSSIARAFVP